MWTRNPLTKRPIRVGGATHKKLVEIGVIKAARSAGRVRKAGRTQLPRKAGHLKLEGAQVSACYRQGANGVLHEKPKGSFCSFRTKSGMSVYGECAYPYGYLTCQPSGAQ
jgi:hypothetical protein